MSDMLLLIEPLIPALRRYARALLRDRAAADDLVQDCLERAISRWHLRRADGNVQGWLFAILHNLAINRMRQSRSRGRHIAIEDADESVLAHPPAQEDGLQHNDVMRALDRLPEEQRGVLLLVSVEDLTYAEAAAVLGIPIGTVMSRLARGREKLRGILEDGTGEVVGRGSYLRRVK